MHIIYINCASLTKSKNHLMLAGVEHVGGDMFETVPKADAIFMKVSGCLCLLLSDQSL